MQLGFLLLNPFQVTAFTITRHGSHIYYFTRFNRNCSKHSIETRKSFLLPCIIPWHIGVKNIICWCCTIKYFLDGCIIKCLFSFNNFFYSKNSFIVILTVIGFGMFISVLNLLIPSWPWLSDRMVYTIFWLISKHLFTLVEVKKSWINLQLRVAGSFLLTGVTSILWTLDEDTESFWAFNTVHYHFLAGLLNWHC